jgi:uncharacterized protein
MLKLISNREKDIALTFLKKDPDTNLFFIGDIEQFGLDNDFVQVWLDDFVTPHTALLRYRNNMIITSDDLSFEPKEILGFIDRYHIACFSAGEACFLKMQPVFGPQAYIKDCDMAKLTHIHAFKSNPKVHLATKQDARKIVTSLTKIDEFETFRSINIDTETVFYEQKIETSVCYFFVIEENGEIVANANTSAMSSVSAMIGGVFCLPDYRNHGYATAVVGQLCAFLLNKGITPILFFENPKAASIYHRLGFKDFGKWYMYLPLIK